MKVLLDGYWLPDGPPSGRAVVAGIAQGWVESFPQDDVHVAIRGESKVLPAGVTTHKLASALHPAANYLELPRLARSLQVDAVLTQNFVSRGKTPSFTFVHDVLFQSNPEWFSRLERLYFAPIVWGLPSAEALLTSSDSERDRILTQNRSDLIVRSVGLAPAPGLSAPAQSLSVPLGDRFLLSVGRLNQRKNLGRVLEAHASLSEAGHEVSDLVVVGADAGESKTSLERQWPGVTFLGGVSDGELRWLYENARGLIFASLDEGFGLPPVEALAFGCPVAVSDIRVMREVVGDDGIYFDPTDLSAMGSAILELDTKERRPRREASDWATVAKKVREAMRELL